MESLGLRRTTKRPTSVGAYPLLTISFMGVLFVFVSLFLFGGCDDNSTKDSIITIDNVDKWIAAAKKPKDYKGIAQFYRNQASGPAKMIKYHEKMKDLDVIKKRFPPQKVERMRNHCKKLIQEYTSAKEEYAKLAQVFENFAQELAAK